MNKKNSMIISITIVLLIILMVAGTTYAYITARTNEGGLDTGSGMLDINYTIEPENITGSLISSLDREKGLNAIATASLKESSEEALFNMYIAPTALTNLNIPALKWEVEGIFEEEIVYTNSGDFSTAEVGTPIKIVDGHQLTEEDILFNIYIWLDVSLITSPLDGASFGAKITADSVPITGNF